ncbi:MAG TPA: RNA methyltransferase [Ktedonobacterales bacterium]|nr:RNA methyltransferase [Ktedonobacterales bacterium]
MITSTSNQHVALLRSLHTAKGREREGLFLIEGPHLVEAALDAHVTPRLILYNAEDLSRSASGRKLIGCIEEASAQGSSVYEATAQVIERASDAQTPQGIVAAVASEDLSAERVRAHRRGRSRPLLLVLDAIGDPGNLGTILRSALAADVDEVLLAKGCADPLAPKVVRAGSGAHFHLPVRSGLSWDEIAEALRGAPAVQQVLVAEAGARTPYDDFDLTKRTALIVGNEAHGVSPEAKRLETAGLSIPMWNRVESLNAAIAASVVLFEAARQCRAAEQK